MRRPARITSSDLAGYRSRGATGSSLPVRPPTTEAARFGSEIGSDAVRSATGSTLPVAPKAFGAASRAISWLNLMRMGRRMRRPIRINLSRQGVIGRSPTNPMGANATALGAPDDTD